MVYCTYCGHQFTRDEHLERHILTHTNVKPFKCFTCHMSFARRDLLQRHYTVHGRDQNQDPLPASNGMIPKSAGRTPIACSNCAKTKTKCDKKFPCTRCSGRNLKCTLRPTRRATKNISRSGILSEAVIGLDPDASAPSLDGCVLQQQQPTITSIPTIDPSNKHSISPQQTVPIRPAGPETTTAVPMPEALQDFSIVEGSPSGSANRHTPATSSTTTAYSPSAQTPGYVQSTTYSATFDGANSMGKADDVTSPRFMLDWSQMAMPITYEGILGPQTVMNGDFNFDPRSMALAPTDDGMFGLLPGGGLPVSITPGETPRMDNLFSEMAIGEAGISMMPQRNHSMPSNASSLIETHNGEIAAVIAAQDSWPAFRCMPIIPSSSCPRTGKLNLERLEQTLRDQQGWSTWSPTEFEKDDYLTVMRLHDSTRDKLLAITQTFLHKALEIHRSPDSSLLSTGGSGSASNFVLLPPTLVLEYFLRSYANCFETYFPVTSKGTLDVNELMHCYNDRAASLLVLMMIAQGAMNISSTEARMLTGGLTEACRISLFDLVEKDITMAGDHNVLHAAMLFTVQAAWSGDKWHMDIAMGQRGMYLAMLRHSNMLENQLSTVNTTNQRQNTDSLWGEWIQSEARSRLVYSWAMADQDIALFHDTPPLFSITEFKVPMPDADRLWHAKSAVEWSENFEQVHEFSGGFSSLGSGARPLSLKDLFCHFLDNEVIHLGIEMTPLQLRLLLHPLQTLVCHASLLLNSFSDPLAARQNDTSRTVTAASTRHRLEEVKSLLKRWFDLAERYLKANSMCVIMQTNLVMYHLISLNAVTNFPEIERLARRETFDGSYQQLSLLHKRCLLDVEEAILHCGQVLRLVRSMPRGRRPPWWAGAIYRAVLIIWTDSLLHKETSSPSMSSTSSSGKSSISGTGMFRVPGPSFAIDALHSDHPLIIRYLTKREGVPYVTRRDGSLMPIDRAYAVLQYGVEVIDEGAATRFSDGIRAKLDRLAQS